MRDFAHRFRQQLFSGRNLVPRRSTGRMRQRDKIEDVSGAMRPRFATDHLIQFRALDKLRDRQTADGNYQTRFQDFDFLVHPGRAIMNFIRRRHAIGSAGRFSRKTSTYSGEINLRSHDGFVHSAKLIEPAEKCLPSGMGERAFQGRLARARRLADQHYVADDGATGNRGRFHSRTTPASK